MRRRTALTTLVAVAVALLLASYVWYARGVVEGLRAEARRTSQMYARIFAAQADPRDAAAELALRELVSMISESGVALIVTDAHGAPTMQANLPPDVERDEARVKSYVAELDSENDPVRDPATGVVVHFGSTRLVRGLRIVPILQSTSLALLLIGAIVLLVTHARAEREQMWAGLARESAHQLGTPLSSLHGWIEVLRERSGDPLIDSAIGKMEADIDRLERVAHRFERIGRPPKRDKVNIDEIIRRVVDYFQARVPTLATPVRFAVDVPDRGLVVSGDRVLLEWVLESLIKNAVDALAGTGGTITVQAESLVGGKVRVRVADDGPGVPPEVRSRVFDAGFTTKERGWGIGLALARRIIHENHGGRLSLAPSAKGAAFDIILPA